MAMEKPIAVVGIDERACFYALRWTFNRLFFPYPNIPPFKLVIMHAKPSPSSAVGLAGPGAAEILLIVDSYLRKIAAKVVEKLERIKMLEIER